MKHKYKILGLSLFSFMLGGCEKYFDVNPDMRTELNTADKVGQLLVTAYPNADYFLFAESASDNAWDKGPGDFSKNDIARESYFWNEVTQVSDNYSPNTYWLSMYKAIGAANQAIEAIDENDFGNIGQQYKGEALLARAYAHHMLVSLFSKAYQINGDNSTYGVPYITLPEKIAFQDYDRGTVASVYVNIEKDLLEGLRLIKGISFKSAKFHFNEQAANAFAARFYLFKGEYDKVVQYSSAIFPENNFKANLRPIAGAFKAAGGSATSLFASSAGSYNLLLANVFSEFASVSSSNRYGIGLSAEKVLTAPTVAGKEFFNYFLRTGGLPDKLSLVKYASYQFRESVFSSTWTKYTIQCLFSADEALMNRAEAYINNGNYDLALRDLNDFAAVRIDGYDPSLHTITTEKVLDFYKTTDLKEGLIKTVLDFKQKAFMQEGIRWFDLMRLGLEITHNHIDENWVNSTVVLGKDDLRRAFQLPESTKLSGLPQNPR